MADQFEALRKAVADVCLPIGNMDPDGRTKILDRRYAFQREASVGAIKALLDAYDQLAAIGVTACAPTVPDGAQPLPAAPPPKGEQHG